MKYKNIQPHEVHPFIVNSAVKGLITQSTGLHKKFIYSKKRHYAVN